MADRSQVSFQVHPNSKAIKLKHQNRPCASAKGRSLEALGRLAQEIARILQRPSHRRAQDVLDHGFQRANEQGPPPTKRHAQGTASLYLRTPNSNSGSSSTGEVRERPRSATSMILLYIRALTQGSDSGAGVARMRKRVAVSTRSWVKVSVLTSAERYGFRKRLIGEDWAFGTKRRTGAEFRMRRRLAA